jgi:hypothetical protein
MIFSDRHSKLRDGLPSVVDQRGCFLREQHQNSWHHHAGVNSVVVAPATAVSLGCVRGKMLAISPRGSASMVSGSAQPAEMNLRRLIVDWSDTVMPRRCSTLLLWRAGGTGHHLIYPHHKTIRSYCCNCDTRNQHGSHQQKRKYLHSGVACSE